MGTPISTVNLALDQSAVNGDGNAYWWYKRVTSAGAALGTPDTWHLGVGRLSSDFEYGKPEEQLFDEGRNPFGTKKGQLTAMLTLKSAQDEVNTEKFLTREVEGKYFSIVQGCGISHYTSPVNYAKIRFLPICKIEQSYKTAAPDGREPEFKIRIQANKSTITFGAASPNTINELITDINAKLNLDSSASDTTVFSVGIDNGYDVQAVKMTF